MRITVDGTVLWRDRSAWRTVSPVRKVIAMSTSSPTGHGPRVRPLWLVFGLLLFRTVLLALSAAISVAVAESMGVEAREVFPWLNVVIVGVDLLTILVIALLLRADGREVRDLVGRFRLADLPWAGIVMLAVFVAFIAGTFVGNLIVFGGPPPVPESGFVPPLWLGIWTILIMPITVALAEELLYRGYAHEQLAARMRPLVAVLIIAVFFGLQHAPLSASSPGEMVARVTATLFAGIAFGLLRLAVKRLMPLIIGHWAFDVVGLGLPVLVASLGS